MSVMFSKVKLIADNGNTAVLLCSGCPRDNYDLEDWMIYQKFVSDNLHCKSVNAEVETYLYGDGEVFTANEYEIAAFTGRGEKFLHHPDVRLQSISSFTIYPSVVSLQNVLDKLI